MIATVDEVTSCWHTSQYTFDYITGRAQTPEVCKRNIDAIQKVSNLLIAAIGDRCPPAEG